MQETTQTATGPKSGLWNVEQDGKKQPSFQELAALASLPAEDEGKPCTEATICVVVGEVVACGQCVSKSWYDKAGESPLRTGFRSNVNGQVVRPSSGRRRGSVETGKVGDIDGEGVATVKFSVRQYCTGKYRRQAMTGHYSAE